MTGAAILLGVLLIFAGVFHFLTERRWTAERTRLLNAALSDHATEFTLRQTAAGQDEPKRRSRPDAPPKPVQIGL